MTHQELNTMVESYYGKGITFSNERIVGPSKSPIYCIGLVLPFSDTILLGVGYSSEEAKQEALNHAESVILDEHSKLVEDFNEDNSVYLKDIAQVVFYGADEIDEADWICGKNEEEEKLKSNGLSINKIPTVMGC